MQEERLQKVIAQSGLTSRRKAEQLILEGRVKVNNKLVTTLGTKVSPKDEITVDGVPLEKERNVYYVLYKPRGYISSVKDDKGRKTVIDLLPEVEERIFPIGRLDYNSTGVLLLTNDGEFAHLLMHPRHEIEKVYIVKIKGIPTETELKQLKVGIRDQDELLKVKSYRIIARNRKKRTMTLELTLLEGKNRHIRRMMEALGYPVLKLKREKYGIVTLEKLQPGHARPLTPQEIHELRMLATKNVKH